MNTTATAPVVEVGLARNVLQPVMADADWRILPRTRPARSRFEGSSSLARSPVIDALLMAVWPRRLRQSVLLRCDQGSQDGNDNRFPDYS